MPEEDKYSTGPMYEDVNIPMPEPPEPSFEPIEEQQYEDVEFPDEEEQAPSMNWASTAFDLSEGLANTNWGKKVNEFYDKQLSAADLIDPEDTTPTFDAMRGATYILASQYALNGTHLLGGADPTTAAQDSKLIEAAHEILARAKYGHEQGFLSRQAAELLGAAQAVVTSPSLIGPAILGGVTAVGSRMSVAAHGTITGFLRATAASTNIFETTLPRAAMSFGGGIMGGMTAGAVQAVMLNTLFFHPLTEERAKRIGAESRSLWESNAYASLFGGITGGLEALFVLPWSMLKRKPIPKDLPINITPEAQAHMDAMASGNWDKAAEGITKDALKDAVDRSTSGVMTMPNSVNAMRQASVNAQVPDAATVVVPETEEEPQVVIEAQEMAKTVQQLVAARGEIEASTKELIAADVQVDKLETIVEKAQRRLEKAQERLTLAQEEAERIPGTPTQKKATKAKERVDEWTKVVASAEIGLQNAREAVIGSVNKRIKARKDYETLREQLKVPDTEGLEKVTMAPVIPVEHAAVGGEVELTKARLALDNALRLVAEANKKLKAATAARRKAQLEEMTPAERKAFRAAEKQARANKKAAKEAELLTRHAYRRAWLQARREAKALVAELGEYAVTLSAEARRLARKAQQAKGKTRVIATKVPAAAPEAVQTAEEARLAKEAADRAKEAADKAQEALDIAMQKLKTYSPIRETERVIKETGNIIKLIGDSPEAKGVIDIAQQARKEAIEIKPLREERKALEPDEIEKIKALNKIIRTKENKMFDLLEQMQDAFKRLQETIPSGRHSLQPVEVKILERDRRFNPDLDTFHSVYDLGEYLSPATWQPIDEVLMRPVDKQLKEVVDNLKEIAEINETILDAARIPEANTGDAIRKLTGMGTISELMEVLEQGKGDVVRKKLQEIEKKLSEPCVWIPKGKP